MTYALGDIQFTLERATAGFSLTPEILLTRARILFTLRRDPEAVVALYKAIAAKPDYVPAYFRLSNYFVDKGDKATAIKILEQGIDNTENAEALIKKLAKLGKAYDGVPGSKRKNDEPSQEAAANNPQAQIERSEEKTSAPITVPTQAEDQAAKGPYCRFCP